MLTFCQSNVHLITWRLQLQGFQSYENAYYNHASINIMHIPEGTDVTTTLIICSLALLGGVLTEL